MNEFLEKFVQADGYIIGSPVYSIILYRTIMFFNRMRPWRVFSSLSMEGKVGGAIAVGGPATGTRIDYKFIIILLVT